MGRTIDMTSASNESDSIQTEEDLERAIAEEQQGETQEQTSESDSLGDESLSQDFNVDTTQSEDQSAETESETPAPDADQDPEPTEEQEEPDEEPEPEQKSPETSTEPAQPSQAQFSGPLAMVDARLKDYIEKMRPALPIEQSEILNQQASLYRAFKTVMNLNGRDFVAGMDLLVEAFRNNLKGVFAEKYAARGFDNISLGARDRLAFSRLMRLVRVTARIGQKDQVTKHVDLEKVLDALPAHSHEKLLEYYSAQ